MAESTEILFRSCYCMDRENETERSYALSLLTDWTEQRNISLVSSFLYYRKP